MDELNSLEARKLSPGDRIEKLTQAIVRSDQRIRIRKEVSMRGGFMWCALFGAPISWYVVYHYFAPEGVMQNYKSATGMHLYWMNSFMLRPRSLTERFMPEIHYKEQGKYAHVQAVRIKEKQKVNPDAYGGFKPYIWH